MIRTRLGIIAAAFGCYQSPHTCINATFHVVTNTQRRHFVSSSNNILQTQLQEVLPSERDEEEEPNEQPDGDRTVNGDGNIALHFVVANHSMVDMIQSLHAKGSDATAANNDGQTPLHAAASIRNAEVIKILCREGADPNATDNKGRSPMHIATLAGLVANIKELEAAGGDVNLPNANDRTPMHVASKFSNKATIEALFELNAALNDRDVDGMEPIHFSNINTAGVLVDLGADVNAVDDRGRTALHYATESADIRFIKLLLELGATVVEDGGGLSPLDLLYERRPSPQVLSRIGDLFDQD